MFQAYYVHSFVTISYFRMNVSKAEYLESFLFYYYSANYVGQLGEIPNYTDKSMDTY